MASVPPPSKPAPPQRATRIDMEAIDLPGGWHGRVALRIQGETTEHSLPTLPAWQAALQTFVNDPFSIDQAVTLKYSRGAEVLHGALACEGGRLEVVAKHHTPFSAGARISAMLTGSRAQRNFDRAAELLASGVSTAVPLAWIARSKPKRESWWMTMFAPDLVDLDHIALSLLPQVDPDHAHSIKRDIIHAVAELFLGLTSGGWHHRDLKASNVLLRHWDTPGHKPEAWIVDLDGLSRSGASSRSETQRLVRLGASLRSYASMTRTDYVRFLKAYRHADSTTPNRPTADWRHEFRLLARAAERYAEKSTLRKSHKIDGYAGD